MLVGILKEIKTLENRVSMTPAGVVAMVHNGHQVVVETKAGIGAGFSDEDYKAAGATMSSADDIFAKCDMVMHVKEPQPSEFGKLRKDQILFTYLHLAADEEQTKALIKVGGVNIAYETIEKADHTLPLLIPMSEVAGRMAAQEAAKYCERQYGGRGLLLGGVTGVEPGIVLVIGGGVVGTNAAMVAAGLGARVYILDMNLDRLRYLSEIMPKNCIPLMSSPALLRDLAKKADAIIGAVLVVGAKAPKLITRDMLKTLKPGCVLVDVAIDQGGCFETSKATTHDKPIFEIDGVIHYCVGNMPGAVPITSTMALTNATLPYAIEIANKGWKKACRDNQSLKLGLNVVEGKVTFKAVADVFGLPYTSVENVL